MKIVIFKNVEGYKKPLQLSDNVCGHVTFALSMPELGKIQVLEVLRDTSAGLFLGDGQGEDVLLPGQYTDRIRVHEEVQVFVYKDSENRLIATTNLPVAQVGDFACLEVKEATSFGAFLNWGTDKDLFVPFDEQLHKLKKGDWCEVFIFIDEKSGRLVGSTKLGRFLNKDTGAITEGEQVELIIWEESELGLRVIINKQYEGLLFYSDLFQDVLQGDILEGYISKKRPDGKLDVRLGKRGYQNIEPNADKVHEVLVKAGGFLPFNDHSDPEQIVETFKMSKKLFKKAIGLLYKQRVIEITETGIQKI